MAKVLPKLSEVLNIPVKRSFDEEAAWATIEEAQSLIDDHGSIPVYTFYAIYYPQDTNIPTEITCTGDIIDCLIDYFSQPAIQELISRDNIFVVEMRVDQNIRANWAPCNAVIRDGPLDLDDLSEWEHCAICFKQSQVKSFISSKKVEFLWDDLDEDA